MRGGDLQVVETPCAGPHEPQPGRPLLRSWPGEQRVQCGSRRSVAPDRPLAGDEVGRVAGADRIAVDQPDLARGGGEPGADVDHDPVRVLQLRDGVRRALLHAQTEGDGALEVTRTDRGEHVGQRVGGPSPDRGAVLVVSDGPLEDHHQDLRAGHPHGEPRAVVVQRVDPVERGRLPAARWRSRRSPGRRSPCAGPAPRSASEARVDPVRWPRRGSRGRRGQHRKTEGTDGDPESQGPEPHDNLPALCTQCHE